MKKARFQVCVFPNEMAYLTLMRSMLGTRSNAAFMNELMNRAAPVKELQDYYSGIEAPMAGVVLKLVPRIGRKKRFKAIITEREYKRFKALTKELGLHTNREGILGMCFLVEKQLMSSVMKVLVKAIDKESKALEHNSMKPAIGQQPSI